MLPRLPLKSNKEIPAEMSLTGQITQVLHSRQITTKGLVAGQEAAG